MVVRLLLALGLIGLAALAPMRAQDKQDCPLTVSGAFPIDLGPEGVVRIPTSLNDKPFAMVVDTGAYMTVISGVTADDLNLKPQMTGTILLGFGGNLTNVFVEVDKLALGKIARGKTRLMVEYPLPRRIAGFFGADFLYFYDLDFDFANAKLNFISPDHCPGKVVYWTKGPYGKVPFSFHKHDIALKIMLDGKVVDAIIDTGMSTTVMSLDQAIDIFDLDKKTVGEGLNKDLFKQISFGAVTVNNPAILLVSDAHSRLMGGSGTKPSMILGMDILRNLHFYISYKEEMIYVTPASQY